MKNKKNKEIKTKKVIWADHPPEDRAHFDKKIRIKHYTNKITATEVKKMKLMMRNILDGQPFFIHFLVGEIHSPSKTLRLTPVITFPLREDYEFITAGESTTKEGPREHKKQKRKSARRR